MKKMNPKNGADKIFVDSCPDLDNMPTYTGWAQSGFLKDMKYQTEINMPLSHMQFSLLPSQAEAVSNYS